MGTHASKQLVQAYFEAINNTQLDELAQLFADDAELHFPMMDPIVGRAAIRQFYEGVLQFYPKRFDDARRFFFSEGGDVAVEIHFEGTTMEGKEVVFDAVDLFTIRGGQIRKLQIFYDSAKVMQMIGTLPQR